MAENKTKPTDASVAEYIASRANEEQSQDFARLAALLKKITKSEPKMWGPSVVGNSKSNTNSNSSSLLPPRPQPFRQATWRARRRNRHPEQC